MSCCRPCTAVTLRCGGGHRGCFAGVAGILLRPATIIESGRLVHQNVHQPWRTRRADASRAPVAQAESLVADGTVESQVPRNEQVNGSHQLVEGNGANAGITSGLGGVASPAYRWRSPEGVSAPVSSTRRQDHIPRCTAVSSSDPAPPVVTSFGPQGSIRRLRSRRGRFGSDSGPTDPWQPVHELTTLRSDSPRDQSE